MRVFFVIFAILIALSWTRLSIAQSAFHVAADGNDAWSGTKATHEGTGDAGYDNMKIPRIKGKRREVRRMLAEQSRRLLEKYRAGDETDLTCPLRQALSDTSDSPL